MSYLVQAIEGSSQAKDVARGSSACKEENSRATAFRGMKLEVEGFLWSDTRSLILCGGECTDAGGEG
jgi:hypothetical protein